MFECYHTLSSNLLIIEKKQTFTYLWTLCQIPKRLVYLIHHGHQLPSPLNKIIRYHGA